MSIGPVELLVLKFPVERVGRNVAGSLQDLVQSGLIRVIDLVFARKSGTNGVQVLELHELEDEDSGMIEPLVADITGFLNGDDVEKLTAAMEPGSSAAIMLFEHAWAKNFADQVAAAHGEVVLAERIPRAVIDELVRAHEEEPAPMAAPAGVR
ncbi:MAG TPA: DUF6325 family protein [Candidatus Limnocylindrales bacterium]